MNSIDYLVRFFSRNGINNIVLEKDSNIDSEIGCAIKTYKVFDRRSMAYYAMGLSQQLNAPVMIIIKNQDAVAADLLPGITEAYYQNVPLLVVVCNEGNNWLKDIEVTLGDQCNYCESILGNDWNDSDLISKRINSVNMCLYKGRRGPALINIDCQELGLMGNIDSCTEVLKGAAILDRIDSLRKLMQENDVVLQLDESDYYSQKDIQIIKKIASCFDCGLINGNVFTLSGITKKNCFSPTLVIQFGKCNTQHNMNSQNCMLWVVSRSLDYCSFKTPELVVNCDWRVFAKRILSDCTCSAEKTDSAGEISAFCRDNSIDIINKIIENINVKSWVFGNTIYGRNISSYFVSNKNLDCICNINPTGSDGTVSMFIGHCVASAPVNNYLFIDSKDLALDLNALHIRHKSGNCRICVFVDQEHLEEKNILASWGLATGFEIVDESHIENFTTEYSDNPRMMISIWRWFHEYR